MEDFKQKDFWQRPEGKVGTVVLALIIVVAGVLLYKLLPFLIIMAQNTIYLIVMVAIIAILLLPVFDKRARTLISFMYKVGVKKATSLFIEIDPIAIVEIHIHNLKEKQREFQEKAKQFNGAIKNLRNKIATLKEEKENCLKMAHYAGEHGNKQEKEIKARKSSYISETITKLEKMEVQMNHISDVLKKTGEATNFVIEDTENKVELKKTEYTMMKEADSAVKSAMRILRGDLSSADLYNNAMEYMADEIGYKLGEIDSFLDTTSDIFNSIDISNGMMTEKGLEELKIWENEKLNNLYNSNI